MDVGVVTGLSAEAALARGVPGAAAACGGGRPARTRALAEELVAGGAAALLSFGIAGGLAPGLGPGALIVATAVVSASAWHPTAADWQARILARLPEAAAGAVHGCDQAVATAPAKAALYERTGALAADMESHIVADVAARAGVAFAVIRAVADPAQRSLPLAAIIGLDEKGKPAVGAVLVSLVRAPGQLPGFFRAALDARAALAALARAAGALQPAFLAAVA